MHDSRKPALGAGIIVRNVTHNPSKSMKPTDSLVERGWPSVGEIPVFDSVCVDFFSARRFFVFFCGCVFRIFVFNRSKRLDSFMVLLPVSTNNRNGTRKMYKFNRSHVTPTQSFFSCFRHVLFRCFNVFISFIAQAFKRILLRIFGYQGGLKYSPPPPFSTSPLVHGFRAEGAKILDIREIHNEPNRGWTP